MRRILIAIAALAALLSPAKAADSTAAALSAASALGGTELLYCTQGGADRKCTAAQAAAYVYGLMSGDATGSGVGAVTLATVNSNVGTFGSSTNCVTFTVNAKGLITASSQTACAGGGGGGGSPATQTVVNNWYTPLGPASFAAGANSGIGSTRLFPGFVDTTLTTSSLGVRVQSLFSGGFIQAAIYAADATTKKPTGNPICSTASMSTTLIASVNSAASCPLTANTLYWFATNTDNATSIPVNVAANTLFPSSKIGSTTQGNIILSGTATFIGYSTPQTFGTWGDLTAATFTDVTAATIPVVQIKIGSVP